MQCLRLNTVLWISASFQLRSHAVQCSCSQLPYNFPPEIKSTTNFVTGNIAQVFNICKRPAPGYQISNLDPIELCAQPLEKGAPAQLLQPRAERHLAVLVEEELAVGKAR